MTLDEDTLITEIHAAVVRTQGVNPAAVAAAAIAAIRDLYGGHRVYVPSLPNADLLERDAMIRDRRFSGVSVAILADQFELSERMIRKICKAA